MSGGGEEDTDEETLQDYGYDPEEHVSFDTVNDALDAFFRASAPTYVSIAPPRVVVVVKETLMLEFQLFMGRQGDRNKHPTLIISRAGVIKSHQRKGVFTNAMADLIAYVKPHFVELQAVLSGGGMPEWATKNGYLESEGSGNWVKSRM